MILLLLLMLGLAGAVALGRRFDRAAAMRTARTAMRDSVEVR